MFAPATHGTTSHPGETASGRSEGPHNSSSGGKWLGKLALAVLVPLLALCILEVAMRAYAHLASQERLIVADNVLGWRLIPNARKLYRNETQPYLVRINSKGLRDLEHSYDKPAGAFRILVIGDSFVFGAGGVEPANRFADILAKSANVEVINTGVPGYGADQEYLYLKTEGLKYHPDLVLLCAFYNDFSESFSTINPSIGRPKGYLSLDGDQLVFHPPSFSTFYALSQHSYVLGLADLALSKLSGTYFKSQRLPQGVLTPSERLATFKQIYASAQKLCQEQGINFVVVYLPFKGQYSPSVIQQVMADLAATEGLKTLDLTDTMKHANAARPAYFAHDIHFNEYGNQVVAAALLQYLVSNRLLNPDALQAQPVESRHF
jgi:lysophospholipase L1-like esterase